MIYYNAEFNKLIIAGIYIEDSSVAFIGEDEIYTKNLELVGFKKIGEL